MAPSTKNVLYTALFLLLVLLSLAIFGIGLTSADYIHRYQNTAVLLAQNQLYLSPIPKSLYHAAAQASLASSVICFIFTVALWRYDWQNRGRSETQTPRQIFSIYAAVALNGALSLLSTTALLITHTLSSSFDINYRSSNGTSYGLQGIYDGGSFDLETWTCQSQAAFIDLPEQSVVKRQCAIETAGKSLAVALTALIVIHCCLTVSIYPVPIRAGGDAEMQRPRAGEMQMEEGRDEEEEHRWDPIPVVMPAPTRNGRKVQEAYRPWDERNM